MQILVDEKDIREMNKEMARLYSELKEHKAFREVALKYIKELKKDK